VSDSETRSTSLASGWTDTQVLNHIRELCKEYPDTADQVLEMVAEQLRHRRDMDATENLHRQRLEWAWFGFRVFMAVLGFVALVIYSIISGDLINAGQPAQASLTLGAGAASVVAIFVTGRAAAPLFSP
jgi:hypothetical protein